MRTTLSIDDDVLHAVRDRARRERRSVGDVLSDLARDALIGSAEATSAEVSEVARRNGFVPLPHRGAPVTRELVQRLLDEDE